MLLFAPLDLILKVINNYQMCSANLSNRFPIHACQYCGAELKLVETIIDDEFAWSDKEQIYQPNKFSDCFEHTGNNRCALCLREWTGK